MTQKVLIVEDAPEYRTLASQAIRRAGYDVQTAADGCEGLAQIERSRPSAVVCDLMLPRLGGFGLLEEVRARDKRLPFILTSTWDNEIAREHALELGADAFVPKDDEARQIVEALRRCCRIPVAAARVAEPPVTISLEPPAPRASAPVPAPAAAPAPEPAPPAAIPIAQWKMAFENRLDDALASFCRQGKPLLEGLEPKRRVRLAEAAAQAIRVAIACGNLELGPEWLFDAALRPQIDRRAAQAPYRARMVHALGVRQASRIRLCLADQGPGFDYRTLAETQLGLAGYLFGQIKFSSDGRCFQLVHELRSEEK
jgi:CheY-like chemotaxis protein